MVDPYNLPILVEITRGVIVEKCYRGSIAILNSENNIIASTGNINSLCFFRSCAKPFQAVLVFLTKAIERYNITQQELALITGSHNGEPIHIECVSNLLQRLNLSAETLKCGTHPPYTKAVAALLKYQQPTVLHNNCSGKHTGLLASILAQNLNIQNYEELTHPIQQLASEIISDFSSFPLKQMAIGIDGCTIPTWAIPLRNIALAYAHLAYPNEWVNTLQIEKKSTYLSAISKITNAMMSYPEMVAGTDRIDTSLMQMLPGKLISKVGADGVHAMTVFPDEKLFPKGLGIAIKIEDGDTYRARNAVVIDVLEKLRILTAEQVVLLKSKYCPVILNHRKQKVGEVRTTFDLR